MHLCSKCGAEHDRPQRYCAGCHAAYMREWRKKRITVTRETFLTILNSKAPERAA